MGSLDVLCYWVSLTSAALLTYLIPISSAHDRPIHILVAALVACSFALPATSRLIPELFHPAICKQRGGYTSVPLDHIASLNGSTDEGLDLDAPNSLQERPKRQDAKVRITVLSAAVIVLSTRLEVYRQISKATECTIVNVEIFLPFLLALYDAFRSQKPMTSKYNDKPDATAYEAYRTVIASWITKPRTRYVLPIFFVCYGCYLAQGFWTSSNSTYICPIVTREQYVIPALQFLALLLDFLASVIAYETSPGSQGTGLSPRRCVILWSSTFLTVPIIWTVVAMVVYLFKPEYRSWLLLFAPPIEFGTFIAIGFHIFLLCALFISALHCITTYGCLDMSIHFTVLITMIPTCEFIWSHRYPFPPTSKTVSTVAFLLVSCGWYHYRRLQQSLGEKDSIPRSRLAIVVLTLCLLVFPIWRVKSYVHYHPIDMLIYDAKLHHDKYVNSVGSISSLEDTVTRYHQRYGRAPPPGFDVWFEYARNNSAFIVDEFDQIYKDLLPFQAIPPHVLRKQTWEMVSNPWNEISGISIRSGIALVQENVLPTHKWMVDGIAVLINKFAQHLPDMDLAFNLNDESRVAVPHSELQRLLDQGQAPTEDAGNTWLPIAETEVTETVFQDMSFRNTFRAFGSIGCPASSYARTHPHVSSKSHICYDCVAPHSLGQFVANWTGAADVCHQPDLANLHGFYLSPAAFKTSWELMPVFSQSKAYGYNDILYPSAWNYMDRVKYSPTQDKGTQDQPDFVPGFPDLPFDQKENVLFWRGSTSEGVSSGDHSWRGMARQRLVHLTNNLTTASHDSVTLLLPHFADHKKYKYVTVPGPSVKQLGLNADTAIVDHIARCGGIGLHDCTDQANEFNVVPPTDFQAHWRYKYLFDLDGAGFSGRFLPFLQSHSLPFKTALFREWYDSRLTAWHHFVPQDLRLHGVWSTLAYFSGLNGTLFGENIWWRAHDKEAERIAEQGREWVDKVIRKEDMEIYFFRLLLEWGRMTDDNRNNLAFTI